MLYFFLEQDPLRTRYAFKKTITSKKKLQKLRLLNQDIRFSEQIEKIHFLEGNSRCSNLGNDDERLSLSWWWANTQECRLLISRSGGRIVLKAGMWISWILSKGLTNLREVRSYNWRINLGSLERKQNITLVEVFCEKCFNVRR